MPINIAQQTVESLSTYYTDNSEYAGFFLLYGGTLGRVVFPPFYNDECGITVSMSQLPFYISTTALHDRLVVNMGRSLCLDH